MDIVWETCILIPKPLAPLERHALIYHIPVTRPDIS